MCPIVSQGSYCLNKATSRPWNLLPARSLVNVKGPNGEQICQLKMDNTKSADALLIVRAVNNHDKLVEALEALITACAPVHIELSSVKAVREMGKLLDATQKAKGALATAKGECSQR